MAPYNTPGVYVEEISTLPPSVAEVSTAIPAFLGYTELGITKIARVSTLLEYEELFGKPHPSSFTVTRDATDQVTTVTRTEPAHEFSLYYAVSHYFKNGGGACYIVSVGTYASFAASDAKEAFEDGLKLLEKEDEPTLIVLTDAVNLADDTDGKATDYYDLCEQALAQCQKMGDRFAILDVARERVADFRAGVSSNLMYGAAYYPNLETTLSYAYADTGVTLLPSPPWSKEIAAGTLKVTFSGPEGTAPSVITVVSDAATTPTFAVSGRTLTFTVKAGTTATAVAEAWTAWTEDTDNDFAVTKASDGTPTYTAGTVALAAGDTLDAIKTTNTALYNRVKARLTSERVVLPPSAAVAGIYARVDRDRGVWKAPANVAASSVIRPTQKVTNEDQDGLNVDTAGKSINAIRAFTGKGTLVWGARTLAGNDNEWRYVSVRRLFIMIEESTRKATEFAVFEPNDMTTWLKVKGMIESFLYGLWERGALAGSAPASAYYVHVGLGKTMTNQDILEGRMIVEIGVAAVRPAEFIVLRFSHKLQGA
jgi:phage tail sheath protein FI